MPVEIRRLSSRDLALGREAFHTMARVFDEVAAPLGDAHLRRVLSRPDFWAFAAVDGDSVVGALTAHTLPMTRSESDEIFIYDLAVVPERQRQGIGRRLVEALRAGARAEGITVTFVPADNDDTHALDFYRAIGGSPAPVTIFTFGDDEA